MSHSENDDKKDQRGPEENPAERIPSDADDPFESLSGFSEGEENENTIQRLSHLISDEPGVGDEGESTTQRLSHLISDDPSASEETGDGTATKLGKLVLGDKESGPGEDTVSRLGGFMEDFLSAEEDEENAANGDITGGEPSETSLVPDSISDFSAEGTSLDGFDSSDAASGQLDSFGSEGDGSLEALLAEPPAEEIPADGDKKKKAPKAKKEAKPRVKKSKKEKKPRNGVDWTILLAGILFVALIAAGNVWAFFAEGIDLLFFLVPFNFFGLILLLVPYLLAVKKRREGVLNLYDAMLGIALTALIFGCMLLLSVQARYGTNIKGTAAAVEYRDVM